MNLRIRTSYRSGVAIAVSAVVLTLAACGPQAEQTVLPTSTQAAAASTATPVPAVVTATPSLAVATATRAAIATAVPTTAPTAAPSPTPRGQAGTVTVGERIIRPNIFLPSKQSAGQSYQYELYGVYECPIKNDEVEAPLQGVVNDKGILHSWVMDSGGSKVTFKIRSGVQFHEGWGELTGEDVLFSLNNAYGPTTKFIGSGGILPYHDRFELIDQSTLVWQQKQDQFNGLFLMGWSVITGGVCPPMISKKAVETLGEETATVTPIGTGPYRALKWVTDEQAVTEAVPTHWYRTGTVKTVKYVAIPDDTARIAAFKTGEIDLAVVPNQFLQSTLDAVPGSSRHAISIPTGQIVYFAGNYWSTTSRDAKAAVFPGAPGFKPEHPWVGDPRDSAHMERARKVRLALNMAIDPEAINKVLLGGFGRVRPAFLPVYPGDPQWKSEWDVPYDVTQAKKLLVEAGYGDGFKVNFWVAPDNPNWDPLIGEAIGQMWREIGVETTIEKTVYAARRPTIVSREIDIPWLFITRWLSLDETGQTMNMTPNSAFNVGIDFDENVELYYATLNELDKEKRIQNNLRIQAYVSEWQLTAPVLDLLNYIAVSPRIAEWKPHGAPTPLFNNPDTLRLK